jgi:hypothetical protein
VLEARAILQSRPHIEQERQRLLRTFGFDWPGSQLSLTHLLGDAVLAGQDGKKRKYKRRVPEEIDEKKKRPSITLDFDACTSS